MAGGVFVGDGAVVVMDPPPVIYIKVFHPGSGPDRHLRKKTQEVALAAIILAPFKTGRLSGSVRADQNRNELGQYSFGYSVSANAPYAYYVHEGTGPSPRWPVNRKVMKFQGSSGDIVYRDFVMHPGTPAVPFLRDALAAMAD
jgi:hypothetical protein